MGKYASVVLETFSNWLDIKKIPCFKKHLKANKFQHSHNAGFSLLTVVVAIGLFGALVTIVGRYQIHQMEHSSSMKLNGDIETLQNLVRAKFDCGATRASAPPECSSEDRLIDVRKSNNDIYIDKDPDAGINIVGRFKLSAECKVLSGLTNRQVAIKATLLKGGGQTAATNKNGEIIVKELFKKVPLGCTL